MCLQISKRNNTIFKCQKRHVFLFLIFKIFKISTFQKQQPVYIYIYIVNFEISNLENINFQQSNAQYVMFSRLGFHFGVWETRKVATKLMSYKIYRKILFQKVALCYLLHFVQDGSSKHGLEQQVFRTKTKMSTKTKISIYSPP